MIVARSTEYYRKNPAARRRKKKTDTEINARPEQIKKRVEANRARRRAKKRGRNVNGLDASHTKNGIVFKPTSKNRGSKSDSAGDKRSRG